MANDNEWVVGLGVKDTDFITFKINNVENSYRFKNFKSSLSECFTVNLIHNGSLTQLMNRSSNNVKINSNYWIEGIDCELTEDGLEKKGKIRLKVTVEFIPDDMDENSLVNGRSPLDDIRQINL